MLKAKVNGSRPQMAQMGPDGKAEVNGSRPQMAQMGPDNGKAEGVAKFPMWLTEKEGEALLICLDAAVKARGLELAKAVAVLAAKVAEGKELMK